MEWSAVRPRTPARDGSAGGALKMACATLLCFAFVALSTHTANRRDGLLQTVRPVAQVYAQPQMMRQQRVQNQLMQQPPIVMGKAMPSLEEAPPAAPVAEPAATMPPAGAVAPAAGMVPAGAVAPAAGMVPAEAVAPAAGMVPVPPSPSCPVEQQCQDNTGACTDGIGCLTQDSTGSVMCSCGVEAPAAVQEETPPPPPVPGSQKWMQDPENAIVAPGPEEFEAGGNLAMMESGNIAVNLNNYLRYKAQREETAAKTEKILLSQLQKAQPCEIEMDEDGVARCKAGTGVGSSSWIPDEMFGVSMPWASSEDSDGKDEVLTSSQAGQLKSNLEGVEKTAQGLTLHEEQDMNQIEAQADEYKGW